jgi:hypothetical protein
MIVLAFKAGTPSKSHSREVLLDSPSALAMLSISATCLKFGCPPSALLTMTIEVFPKVYSFFSFTVRNRFVNVQNSFSKSTQSSGAVSIHCQKSLNKTSL